jgi:TrpR-related protein YerC/YecD
MNEKQRIKNLNKFYKAVLLLNDSKEAKSFLRDLMTENELNQISARLYIAQQLKEGEKSYRKLSSETGLSTTTITRINHWLENGLGGFDTILERLDKSGEKHPG